MLSRSLPSRSASIAVLGSLRRTVGVQMPLDLAHPAPRQVIPAPTEARPRRQPRTRPAGDPVIIGQIALPLSRRIAGMTALMTMLEHVLSKMSAIGAPVPNNVILGERAGGHCRSSIDRAIKRLARCGAVRPEHTLTHRRFWLTSTNQATGWGEYRQGHAPYSTHTRKEVRERPPEAVKPVVVRLGPPAILYPIDLGRVCECQWIVGQESRYRPLFCSAAVVGRSSYCAEHDTKSCDKTARRQAAQRARG